MGVWREKFGNLVNSLSTKRKLLIRIAILAALPGAIATFAKLYPFEGVGEWTGIGKDSNKSVTTEQEINPKTKEVTKITKKETENFQSSKTLWDWLGLAGAIAIPIILFGFQQAEQRRSEKQAQTEKEIADNILREQALEAYFDRMSELLIDKNLKVLIGKKLEESDLEYPVRDAGLDIARARTLSVLRRLDKDGERKGNVIRFLVDAELISELDLRDANLSFANLKGANLSSAKLSRANFSDADLSDADLSDANLSDANLRVANLSRANLRDANLRDANLRGADLRGANLSGADLSGAILNYADLSCANLSGADLNCANLSRAILNCADLSRANLSGADLSRAILGLAILNYADLRGANLRGADLWNANLSGTELWNAKNLVPEKVKEAKNWEEATYDEKFRVLLGLPPEPSK